MKITPIKKLKTRKTIKKKRMINQILKNSYAWANERLPFKLRYYPIYKKV
jgi:hypothetical protein